MLEKRYKSCKDVRAKEYWLVVKLAKCKICRKQSTDGEFSFNEIATIISSSSQKVSNIVRRYNELGPEGFLPKSFNPEAMTNALNQDELEKLIKVLCTQAPPDGECWSGKKVGILIRKMFQKDMSEASAWRLWTKIADKEGLPNKRRAVGKRSKKNK